VAVVVRVVSKEPQPDTVSHLIVYLESVGVARYKCRGVDVPQLMSVLIGDDGSPEKVRFRRYAQMLRHEHMVPIGRLSFRSHGLLLLTNDGDLSKFLSYPSARVQQTYVMRLRPAISPLFFEKCDECRWTVPRTELIHYLRLAAIHDHHCESTRRLVEVYRDDGRELIALYFVLRLALQCKDVWANSTIARYVQHGEPSCLPRYTALAVYFFQRAAQAGCTAAMVSLATIFINEAAEERDSTTNTARAVKWIHAAEYRGAPGAYLLQARAVFDGNV
jgi:hypothetical protein